MTRKDKEEDLKDLKNQLEKLTKQHSSAWSDYGSELCAGEMIRKERELQEEINILEKELK